MENHKILKKINERKILKDGTSNGEIFCDVTDFRVGQTVTLKSNTQKEQSFVIDKIYEDRLKFTISMEKFKVVDNAVIFASSQQRPNFSTTDVERVTYEEAPVVARRVYQVDEFGNYINSVDSQILSQEPLTIFKYNEYLCVNEIIECKEFVAGAICKRTKIEYNENLGVKLIYTVIDTIKDSDL